MEDRERRACRSVEALGREDWEGTVRGLASPGLIHEETGSGRRWCGIEAVLRRQRAWQTAFPDLSGEVTRVVSGGNATALEIVWRGTHTGPLPLPLAGSVPPSGRSIEARAAMWQRWDDELLAHARHHLDLLTLLTQLGVLPPVLDASPPPGARTHGPPRGTAPSTRGPR